ncbi:MAG: Rieske 2Fe-2S domain-containing protein [Burkholderiaceae bacterium]|nr:Rieske 2Fe-2S domain-containing protein [Burkholderiaceae bacterium]
MAMTPHVQPALWPDFEHTGPGTLAGRYLRSFWQPVYLSASLARGRAKPLKVFGEQFTIYRGEDGVARVVADRCLHRGTVLWTGTVEGTAIRCLYHGWKYNAGGQCVERPAERATPGHLQIRTYPTREWAGLVFCYLGEGEAPELPVLDTLSGDGELFVTAPMRPFNYFSQLENGLDEVHFNFVHRISRFAAQGMNAEIPQLACEETEYGLSRTSTRSGVVRRNHFLMPNANSAILFGAIRLVWRTPIDDHSHYSFTVDYFEGTAEQKRQWKAEQEKQFALIAEAQPAAQVAAAILRGELTLDDVVDHPDLLSVQDGVALKGQGVIANRQTEVLGQSDHQIVRMRRLWVEDMAAIAEGRPRRQWKWPRRLEMTTGLKQAETA